MSLLINGRDLEKSFGTDPLFSALNLSISEGDRLAIIGPNGVGKSTLLKVIAGLEDADAGEVVVRKSTRVVYVPQVRVFGVQETVMSVLLEATQRARLADSESVIHPTLGVTGLTDPSALANSLSGGWQKRLLLAWGLAQQPDVLLLDEPTNHLDLQSTLWLEDLLRQAPFAWVSVSHDRLFIDRTANRTAELNPVYPEGLFGAEGGYADFLESKQAFMQTRTQLKASLANKVVRETAWLQRSPKARTTKAKSRIEAAHRLTAELEEVTQSLNTTQVQVDFSATGRKSKRLLELKSISYAYGEKHVIRNLDLLLTPGSRLGLLGDNGSGKSTLLSLMAERMAPQTGEIRRAPDLRCICFDQHREQLDLSQSLGAALSETGDSVLYRERSIHVVSWAKRFRFKADQLPLPLSQLSGGEQARVLIARLMLRPADVLLLDEPTNDLDLPTLEVLEESLLEFPGALVLVSHDRYLLQRVCGRFLALDGQGGWVNCADYLQWERTVNSPAEGGPKTEPNRDRPRGVSKKLSYKHQREWDAMEEQILLAEQDLAACQARVEDPAIAVDSVKLNRAFEDLKSAQAQVEKLYERWSELEAMQQLQ